MDQVFHSGWWDAGSLDCMLRIPLSLVHNQQAHLQML